MKKILTGLLIAAGTLTLLAGCSSSSSSAKADQTKDSTAAESKVDNSSALQDIKDSGELVLGTAADFAPFEFPDGDGQTTGTDIEIAQAITDDLGVKLKIMDLSFDNLLSSLQAGKLDIVLSGVSATEERAKSVDFSQAYFTPTQEILVKKDNAADFQKAADLTDKNLGAQKGSLQEDIANEQFSDSKIVSVPLTTNLIVQLKSGGLDAVIMESAVAQSYVNANDDLVISDIEIPADPNESYAAALPKNCGDLKTEVDDVIKKLMDDGTIDQWIAKYTALADEQAATE